MHYQLSPNKKILNFQEINIMKKTTLKFLTGISFLLVFFVLTNAANAQNTRKARGVRYTKANVEQVIKRVEERTDKFVKRFDEALDDSRLNGTKREDNLAHRSRQLENATDELRREFDRRDSWIENKNEVRSCLNIATDINKTMKARNYGRETETMWTKLVYELNTLAKVYNLPTIGSRSYR